MAWNPVGRIQTVQPAAALMNVIVRVSLENNVCIKDHRQRNFKKNKLVLDPVFWFFSGFGGFLLLEGVEHGLGIELLNEAGPNSSHRIATSS
jgi:hypothetical protein